jgi:hypothetical protein
MEHRLMFRIIRMPPVLDKFFHALQPHVHWNHCAYFRLLVVGIAFAWGRRHVASLYRYLDTQHHRTRVHHFCLVARWDPEAVLRHNAQELVMALHPRTGETLSLVSDDSNTATRGTHMDAVATMKDPVTAGYVQGHQDVCAILRFRNPVMPYSIRLYVKLEHCPAVDLPFRKTTELAAQLMRACEAPAGVKVMVRCDPYDRCRGVVQACRARHVHVASTLKSHRTLFNASWKLQAGRYGRHLFRRRRTATLVRATPHGQTHDRFVDAGWLEVRTLGPLPVVCSRKGTAQHILGRVTDDSALAATDLMQTYETRWAVAPFFTDRQQLLGRGQYQNRTYQAAVTHLHLVCLAYALLTHLRLMRPGAQGQRIYDKAADWSTAAAQEQLRGLMWDDIIADLKAKNHSEPVLTALERLRVA